MKVYGQQETRNNKDPSQTENIDNVGRQDDMDRRHKTLVVGRKTSRAAGRKSCLTSRREGRPLSIFPASLCAGVFGFAREGAEGVVAPGGGDNQVTCALKL